MGCFTMFVGFCVDICFVWYALLFSMSFLVLQSSNEEEIVGCFAYIVFWMSFYCKSHVALPHGAVGWSAVCDCGTSRSFSLTFLL